MFRKSNDPCRKLCTRIRRDTGALPSLVANPFTINESASRFHSLGRAVAVSTLDMPPRWYFVRIVAPSGMNCSSIFVIGCRPVGANTAGSVGRRPTLSGICLARRCEQQQSDNESEHILLHIKDSVRGSSATEKHMSHYLFCVPRRRNMWGHVCPFPKLKTSGRFG